MKPAFVIVIWLLFMLINSLIAESNDQTRRNRIKKGNKRQIEHFWYGLGYGILCLIPFYISRNWWELISLLLLHISVFPVAYNVFGGLKPFNLSTTSDAITDKIMVKLGLKTTKWVNIITLILSIGLLFFQILKR